MKANHFEASLADRLRRSELFQSYQEAFRMATGLPLRIVGSDANGWCLDDQTINRSPFCEELNVCSNACQACIETNRRLINEASVGGPTSCHCFAGLIESAVPIKLGAVIVAYLKTGQVFTRMPLEADFDRTVRSIGLKTLDASSIQKLHDAYFKTKSVEPERYQSDLTLLQIFASHLSLLAESMATVNQGAEPRSISKARNYIESHFREEMTLASVAHEAGMSESYFCRIFREKTGLTLTEYVNRYRVEMAKHELLKTERRVSEIAFEVGFQSLSQFNRSFAQIAGMSPTHWRKDALAKIEHEK